MSCTIIRCWRLLSKESPSLGHGHLSTQQNVDYTPACTLHLQVPPKISSMKTCKQPELYHIDIVQAAHTLISISLSTHLLFALFYVNHAQQLSSAFICNQIRPTNYLYPNRNWVFQQVNVYPMQLHTQNSAVWVDGNKYSLLSPKPIIHTLPPFTSRKYNSFPQNPAPPHRTNSLSNHP